MKTSRTRWAATGLLCLGLPLGAHPAHAAASSHAASSHAASSHAASSRTAGRAASGHPAGEPAVMLRLPSKDYGFKQRLRGVRAGAQVTVTFDDSPGIATGCTPAAVADGQPYTVEAAGGAIGDRTTAPDPDKKANTLGRGVWRTGQTYTFTAGENEPLLTFTSQVSGTANAGGMCGPLIAKR
jgi:hypothetical protein